MFRIAKFNPLQLIVLLSITIGVLKSDLECLSGFTDLFHNLRSNTLRCLAGNAATGTASSALRGACWLLDALNPNELCLED